MVNQICNDLLGEITQYLLIPEIRDIMMLNKDINNYLYGFNYIKALYHKKCPEDDFYTLYSHIKIKDSIVSFNSDPTVFNGIPFHSDDVHIYKIIDCDIVDVACRYGFPKLLNYILANECMDPLIIEKTNKIWSKERKVYDNEIIYGAPPLSYNRDMSRYFKEKTIVYSSWYKELFDVLCFYGQHSMLLILINRGNVIVDGYSIFNAIMSGDLNVVKLVHSLNPEIIMEEDDYYMYIASSNMYFDIADWFIEIGIEPIELDEYFDDELEDNIINIVKWHYDRNPRCITIDVFKRSINHLHLLLAQYIYDIIKDDFNDYILDGSDEDNLSDDSDDELSGTIFHNLDLRGNISNKGFIEMLIWLKDIVDIPATYYEYLMQNLLSENDISDFDIIFEYIEPYVVSIPIYFDNKRLVYSLTIHPYFKPIKNTKIIIKILNSKKVKIIIN